MTTASLSGVSLLSSSIGLKATMAATGLVYVGFVLVHMLGNLQIFLGAEALNVYAYNLQHTGPMIMESGAIVWAARVFLLVALALHVITAIKLKRLNRQARPARCVANNTIRASFASRYMMISGLNYFGFYHISPFTVYGFPNLYAGAYTENLTHMLYGVEVEMHNVYGMLVAGFQVTGIAAFTSSAKHYWGFTCPMRSPV